MLRKNIYIFLSSMIILGSVLIPRISHLLGDTLLIISILFVLMLYLLRANYESNFRAKSTPVDLPILLFILFVIISLVRSVNFYDSLRETFKVISYIILFFLIIQYRNKEKIAKTIVWTILITGFFVSIYGIYEHIAVGKTLWHHQEMVFSTFPNPNHFGGYLVMCIALALGLILFDQQIRSEWSRKKIFLILIIITSCIGIYSSNSKGVFLSLVVSLFILAVLKGGKYLKIYIGLAGCILLIVIFLINPIGKQLISYRIMSDTYAYERLTLWKETLNYIFDYPLLGTGIGTFKDYYPQYKSMPEMRSAEFAHNEFLNLWAELGLFALIISIWLLVIFFKQNLILFKNKECLSLTNDYQPGETPCLSKGIVGGILSAAGGVLTQSLVEFNLHTPGIAIAFLSMVAVVISFSASSRLKQRENNIRSLKKGRKVLVYIIIVSGFLFLSFLLIVPLIAEHFFQKGNLYYQKRDYLNAIKKYEKAIKFNPIFTPYHERLGDLYLIEGEILKDGNFIFGAYYEYNKCVKLYPRNVFYKLKLARFYAKYDALDKALGEFEQILNLAPNVYAFQQEYEELLTQVEEQKKH